MDVTSILNAMGLFSSPALSGGGAVSLEEIFTAGENLAVGDVVRLQGGKVYKNSVVGVDTAIVTGGAQTTIMDSVRISDNRVLFVYYNASTSPYTRKAVVVKVEGTNITAGAATDLPIMWDCSLIAIQDDKVLLIYDVGTEYTLKACVLTIANETEVSKGADTIVYTGSSGSGYNAVSRITKNVFLCVWKENGGHSYARTINVADNDTITLLGSGPTQVLSSSYTPLDFCLTHLGNGYHLLTFAVGGSILAVGLMVRNDLTEIVVWSAVSTLITTNQGETEPKHFPISDNEALLLFESTAVFISALVIRMPHYAGEGIGVSTILNPVAKPAPAATTYSTVTSVYLGNRKTATLTPMTGSTGKYASIIRATDDAYTNSGNVIEREQVAPLPTLGTESTFYTPVAELLESGLMLAIYRGNTSTEIRACLFVCNENAVGKGLPEPVGVVLSAANAGQPVRVGMGTLIEGLSGLIPGAMYYNDETGALRRALKEENFNYNRKIGIALTSSVLLVTNPFFKA